MYYYHYNYEPYDKQAILQELIQNADDAGARTVHFYLDKRHHRGKNFLHRDLERFQGPALISYNDACFKKEDWDGITRMQDSVKADDPFKVGQFGIGFNSVYHITGKVVEGNGKGSGLGKGRRRAGEWAEKRPNGQGTS